jgi:hypothetical protein
MKLEFIDINPPQDAWIVTRARTLRGLPPLECQRVQNVMDGPAEIGKAASLLSCVVTIGKRKKAFEHTEVVGDYADAEFAAWKLLRAHERTLITRRTNAALADASAKSSLGIALKRLDDARKKLAAAPNKADE